MTTHLDHIIHAPLNAQVAIVVNCRGITSKVHIRDGIPIGLVTSRLAKNGTHQARPGMAHDQESSFTRSNGGAILVHYVSLNRGQRATGTARLERENGRGTDHDGPCLGLPPRVHDGELIASNVLAIPHQGFSHMLRRVHVDCKSSLW